MASFDLALGNCGDPLAGAVESLDGKARRILPCVRGIRIGFATSARALRPHFHPVLEAKVFGTQLAAEAHLPRYKLRPSEPEVDQEQQNRGQAYGCGAYSHRSSTACWRLH